MIVAYSRGAKGAMVDEDAIAFLFNVSPSAGVIAEGGTGASEAPKMDAEAFASYVLEQFKARVAKSSRRPWEEAKEYYYQLRGALQYRDAEFIHVLAETAAYPDKLDKAELMNMWLSLLRRERKKARTLIAYKIMEIWHGGVPEAHRAERKATSGRGAEAHATAGHPGLCQ